MIYSKKYFIVFSLLMTSPMFFFGQGEIGTTSRGATLDILSSTPGANATGFYFWDGTTLQWDHLSSNGDRYTSCERIFTDGSRDNLCAYDLVTASETDTPYGTHLVLSTKGNSHNYRGYSFISSTYGGTQYSVYTSTLKAGSYASYFLGDVTRSQNINFKKLIRWKILSKKTIICQIN